MVKLLHRKLYAVLRRCAQVCATGMFFCGLAGGAAAAGFPDHSLTIVVPFAPGGNTDIVARAVGTKLAERWTRPVIVDNRPGGSGLLACELAAKASPDGHTLLVGSTGEMSINQSLFRKLPYDPARDFAPISLATISPLLLVKHPSLPPRSVKELVEHYGS